MAVQHIMMGARMSAADAPKVGTDDDQVVNLSDLIYDQPFHEDELFVISPSGRLSLGELRSNVEALAFTLREAGVTPGLPVGTLVAEGASSLVAMFATWSAGAVYVPINSRYTVSEVARFLNETPIALVIGAPNDLAPHHMTIGVVEHDSVTWTSRVVRSADLSKPTYDPSVALVLRTSGTTGRPKAVLLRHSGTQDALDASLRKLRHRSGSVPGRTQALRMNMIPTSLSLWAGIYNTTFSFRANFGVVLLDKFTVEAFTAAVREFGIKSTVLAPAMITMLTDDDTVTDLSPLRFVRSITAPLSPLVARKFYEKFGAFVLNSYGQTELGGEVVGWTTSDVREFGVAKLGAAGRAYEDVTVQIRDTEGHLAAVGEYGEIYVNSPFRMRGYALGPNEAGGADSEVDDSRFVDGFLRTGDIGQIDEDGFLWIQGRISDMINRGGLKVFPDEVEEALRKHPGVRDACVCAVPDHRLGEVPHAWIIAANGGAGVLEELDSWCRSVLAPYKVPTGYTLIESFPRNDIGKVLRRDLAATHRGSEQDAASWSP